MDVFPGASVIDLTWVPHLLQFDRPTLVSGVDLPIGALEKTDLLPFHIRWSGEPPRPTPSGCCSAYNAYSSTHRRLARSFFRTNRFLEVSLIPRLNYRGSRGSVLERTGGRVADAGRSRSGAARSRLGTGPCGRWVTPGHLFCSHQRFKTQPRCDLRRLSPAICEKNNRTRPPGSSCQKEEACEHGIIHRRFSCLLESSPNFILYISYSLALIMKPPLACSARK